MDARQMATITTPNGVTLRVSARTGLQGLSERTRAIIAGMAQAAPAAGIAVIDITAGKEGGHLSHANGTEVDLKAYSPDGSLWTTSQRVALAAGAQAAGADRFGLYSFGKGKLGSGTMHVGFSGPGRPPAVWGADSRVRGDASRRFTDPAEKAFLAAYQAGRPFDIASLGLTPLDPSQSTPQDAQSAIASLVNPTGGTQVPDAPSAAMGFAPTITDAGFAAPDSVRYEGNPFGVGANPPPRAPAPPPAPPMPRPPMEPPPQWASNAGFPLAPIDEALTGQSAQEVLAGGPRSRPSGHWDRGPGGAPDALSVPSPRANPFAPAVGGPNDRRPQPPTPPSRAMGIPDPRPRPDPATVGQRGFPAFFGEQPPALAGGISAEMGNAPPDPMATLPDRMGTNDLGAEMASMQQAMDANFYRRMMEREAPQPAYRAPETATMGERFDMANPTPNAEQMFSLPGMNAPASFPGPDPRIGTAEAGSTTGEFFTPAPPMPSPPPDPMAGRFNDAFSPAGPGMIADLQGAFDRRQALPAPPTMNAQDGINSVFGAPPAPAMPPNLAIPFAEVPGFGVPPAAASTAATPPMGMGTFNDRFSPPVPAPQPISMGAFNERFAGGSVVNTPTPGQPGVVQGTMPTPAGAMDIRPPAQGGPPLPPQATPQASPASPPRQPDPAAERQRSGIVGRVLGGLLGGPIGALGGGLLGGGVGFGFGTASFSPMGGGGSAPYGNGGTTTYQKGTSNALGGSNALSWKSSNGGTVTATQDPWTGTYYTSYGP